MSVSHRKIFIFLILLSLFAGCKKSRYPGTTPFLPAPHKPRDSIQHKPKATAHEKGVIAVINTSNRAFLVYFNKSGQLRVKRFKGIFVQDEKGGARLWRINKKVVKSSGKVNFSSPLSFYSVSEGDRVILSGQHVVNEIIRDIGRPKHAPDYRPETWMFRQRIIPFACALNTVSFLVKTSQYWPGAAHPDLSAALVTIDANKLRKTVFAKRFPMNTLLKDAQKHKKLDKCINSFDSVVPAQSKAGRIKWIASFNNSFAYCGGMIDFRVVGSPPGFATESDSPACDGKGSVLKGQDGKLISREVWDWRASQDCSVVVYQERLGPGDSYTPVPRPGRASKRRNLYLWIKGRKKRKFLGRVSRILCVHFPDHQPLDMYKLAK